MKIFKPDIKNIDLDQTDIKDEEDNFYKYSHGLPDSGQAGEFTLCGVACDEWNYDKVLPRKKITCPHCLEIIRECKSYKI